MRTAASRRSVTIIGAGRAGTAFAAAFDEVGWGVVGPLARSDDMVEGTRGVDLVLLCVSDSAIAEVAASLPSDSGAVVAHVAGSMGTEILPAHFRRGAIHPLVSIPPRADATVLTGQDVMFAVEGDAILEDVVSAFGARAFIVADADRTTYHAAACIASNHLAALLGQVDRVAASAGLGLDAFIPLVRQTLDNVERLGPEGALTGPASRGDTSTVSRHEAALEAGERALYRCLADEAARLAGRAGPTMVDEHGAGMNIDESADT